MVQKVGPEENNVTIKFGGGLHTKASPDEIDGREAAAGQNFLIDIQDRNLKLRKPFDLIGTAPNAGQINGGASLLKSDGTVTTLFQAGNTVYKWDGHSTFTSVGTTNSGSKLRGHWKTHTWNLTDVVLITDLSLLDTVKKWDGNTFSSVVFTDQAAGAFGNFFAKYLYIDAERAIFANTKAGVATPHLIVGCKRSDYTQITVVNRPSSSLGDSDPWFLLSPDLKPINGYLGTFRGSMISTERGEIFSLNGTSAKDFNFQPFYVASAASGLESIEDIGNDFIYGRPGRIESVRDTQNFGNSESTDLTTVISDKVGAYNGWTIVFNSRTRKSYCFPTGVSECWVLDAAIRDAGQLSPWMRWTTSHSMGFQPTFVMSMLDPLDGLEYVFMGDSSGNIYRLEGRGSAGDGGTSTIDVQFLTNLIPARLDSLVYDVEGYVKYVKNLPGTVTLTFYYQGETIFTNSISVPLTAAGGASYYSDSAYYSGLFYYGGFSQQMARRKFAIPGHANEFQVLVEVTGVNDFSINEVGLRFRAA